MTLLTVFYIIGISFGIIFLFLNGAVFFGADSDMDSDVDVDGGDFDGAAGGLMGEAFTLRSLVNFLAFFGWIGVFCIEQGYTMWATIGISVGSSMLLTIIFAAIMFGFKKLQATPKDIDKDDVLNYPATVYLVIPGKDQRGKIQMSIRGALRTIDALSENGEKIDTNSQVTVTGFITDNLVKVSKTN